MNTPNNLLFDLFATQPNSTGKRHGGGKYGEVIFFRMVERKIRFKCAYDSSLWLNPDVERVAKTNNVELIDVHEKGWDRIVKENQVDLIYSCLPYHLKNVNSCKIIATIHGLRGVELPFDMFSRMMFCRLNVIRVFRDLKNELQGKLKESTKIWYKSLIEKKNMEFITVSHHSKYSMLSQYPDLREDSVKVFYSPSTSSKNPAEKEKISEKYFLLVSANRWDKNNLRAIIALDRLFSQGFLKDYKVVITGYQKEKQSVFERLLFGKRDMGYYKIKNPDRFDMRGYVPDEELEKLYCNSYALIYPSLNEGFGYPPIEAMRYGVPVVASAIASIPEILDNAAVYFAPFSIEELMNRIVQIADSEIHERYSKMAIDRYNVILEKQQKDLDLLINYITGV